MRLAAVSVINVDISCLFLLPGALLDLHSFPTRRSSDLLFLAGLRDLERAVGDALALGGGALGVLAAGEEVGARVAKRKRRSEEHTSELQSRENLVCRLLLEKKN